MGDVFRFKVGDTVRVGFAKAQVLALVRDQDSYKVKLQDGDTEGHEITIACRFVKSLSEEK